MSILVYKERKLAGAAASTLMAAQIIEKPACALGLDYSEELLPTYRALARMSRDGLLDWSDVRVFGLLNAFARMNRTPLRRSWIPYCFLR